MAVQRLGMRRHVGGMRPSGTSNVGSETDLALDRLVARANPISDADVSGMGLESPFEVLGERLMVAASTRRRWRPRRRLGAVLVFAVATVVTTGSALGGMYTTHTGIVPAHSGTENDTSELLRFGAPDFPPLVRKLVRDIPFPPGDSAVSRVPLYVRQRRTLGTVQAAGVKGDFTFFAVCAWRGYWLQEHAWGDTAAEATAANGLATVATSQAEKRVDSWWPLYVGVAKREAQGDASAPKRFQGFYRVNCVGLPTPWAGK
jgi:hypothetical protein